MKVKPNRTLIIIAFFSIYVIWGSTYLLNKIAVSELPPFMLASIRFSIAGILILIIAKAIKIPIGITKKQLANCAFVGFLFLSFGNGVVVWALKYVDSGFAALEISAQPLVVLLLMRILQNKKIRRKSLIGVFLGVIGIYLLVSQNQVTSNQNSIIGMIMIFACMLSWGYGSLFVGRADLPQNFFINTAYQMLTGGVFLLLMSITFQEEWIHPINWSVRVQWSMIILILLGSIVAFTSFNYLLKVVSPEKVATSTYVNPIIALFLGWFFLNEIVSLQSIIAAIVLLTGVYFINTSRFVVAEDVTQ